MQNLTNAQTSYLKEAQTIVEKLVKDGMRREVAVSTARAVMAMRSRKQGAQPLY